MKKITYRIEEDSLGKIKVPKNAIYGAQTQRAINNFRISWNLIAPIFLESLAALKAACATANNKSKLMTLKLSKAICLCALDVH